MTKKNNPEDVRGLVAERYGEIAQQGQGCGCAPGGCCGPSALQTSELLGYDPDVLKRIPKDANLGLGCGNPIAIGTLQPGEAVLDLGSGAGIDVFLAAAQVGPTGHVIGVDMTPAMLDKARANAESGGFENVEFRQGLIEELPVDDASVDVVISNCVINLSPEKARVFADVHRVLKPGGRMMISDVVLEYPLSEKVLKSAEAMIGCVAGASLRDDYLQMIRDAGFRDIRIVSEASFAEHLQQGVDLQDGLFGLSRDEIATGLGAATSLNLLALK
jgi:arsenite methyltransferase